MERAEGGRRTGLLSASRVFTFTIGTRLLAANLAAALVLYLYLRLVPTSSTAEEDFGLEVALFLVYVAGGIVVGWVAGVRMFRPVAGWLDENRTPSVHEVEVTLEQPRRQALSVFALWCGGAAFFTVFHMVPNNPMHYDPVFGLTTGALGVLGGLSASMISYLLIEQSLRPIFAQALSETAPERGHTLGVGQRILTSWALGSGVALIAIALAPALTSELRSALWFLVPTGLLVGGVIMVKASRSIARPLAGMRGALAEIEGGNFSARVEVDDGSEVGLLQAGFNRMAAGLSERERLRQVFGTYVDPEIAEHILREGTSLEGEEVEVTIMFLDVRDFTGFAAGAPAREVVRTINRLFDVVVPVIHEHHGHVDKFVGDGVLAVFGAPRRRDDHAEQALQAALQISARVDETFEGALEVGIGLNTGPVVAGNVGGGGRFEFGVIGDAVNVAARIETATRETGDAILLSDRTKELLETAHGLTARPPVLLKGRSDPVRLYAPEISG